MNPAVPLTVESLEPFLHKKKDQLRLDLFVKGIKCNHCVHKISKEMERVPQLDHFYFEAGGQRLSLWADQSEVFGEAIEKIRGIGFDAMPLLDGKDRDNADQVFRSDLKRMAVAGVCAGNIMLFSTAIYLGAEAEFVHFFHKLSFLLVLPPLFYSAQSIWYGFWQSIKSLRFNLDFPIGLALIVGFGLSVFSFFADQAHVYFDSLAVVVFLVLTSRFALKRYVHKIQMGHGAQMIPGVLQVRVLTGAGEEYRAVDAVTRGEKVLVKRGEVVPVDGRLVSATAILDEAVITGESSPAVRLQGDLLYAGSRLCADAIVVSTLHAGAETRVGRSMTRSQQNQRHLEQESFRFVGYFTAFVVVVSVLTFLLGLVFLDFSQAYQRAFAIILVACPCAISFGIPLIQSFSGHLALKNGLILKHPSVLKKIGTIKNIFLDKTGTLTETAVGIVESDLSQFSEKDRQKLFSLELAMEHPVSLGFARIKPEDMVLLPVTNFQYHPACGISGEVDGERWRVETDRDAKEKTVVVRKKDALLGRIRLQTSYKRDIGGFFQSMVEKGFQISILSGDRQEEVEKLRALIPKTGQGLFLWNASPELKQTTIQNQPGASLMVGDGINDIDAMQAATLSLCMPGALENNRLVADATLTRGDLTSILRVFELAKKIVATEKRLLSFTFSYNVFCVAAAALGWITPVAAAILMPVSSVVVLTIVSLSMRRL